MKISHPAPTLRPRTAATSRVAITIAKERPTAHVLGTDVSEDALAVARDNAARLNAELDALSLELARDLAPVDLGPGGQGERRSQRGQRGQCSAPREVRVHGSSPVVQATTARCLSSSISARV